MLPIVIYGLYGSRTFPLGALAGKTVVVTGASSGIGQAVALCAAARGAKTIVLVARSKDKLDVTALAIKNKYVNVQPIVLPADASIPDQARNVAKALSDEGIAVNLLVNCAGRCTLVFLKTTERVDFCWDENVITSPYFNFTCFHACVRAVVIGSPLLVRHPRLPRSTWRALTPRRIT